MCVWNSIIIGLFLLLRLCHRDRLIKSFWRRNRKWVSRSVRLTIRQDGILAVEHRCQSDHTWCLFEMCWRAHHCFTTIWSVLHNKHLKYSHVSLALMNVSVVGLSERVRAALGWPHWLTIHGMVSDLLTLSDVYSSQIRNNLCRTLMY